MPQALRWHDDALWFSDTGRGDVLRWRDGDADATVVARVPGAGGLGFLPGGDLLVASTTEGVVYRVGVGGRPEVHADLRHLLGGPLNDLVTDDAGNAYVGDYGFDFEALTADRAFSSLYAPPGPPSTRLVVLGPDGTVRSRSAPMVFPNGCALVDGGRTLLVCETLAFRISALPVRADATLGPPEPYAVMIDPRLQRWLTAGGPLGRVTRALSSLMDRPGLARRSSSPIAPDDIAVADEGTFWIADALRGDAVRIRRGGAVVERLHLGRHVLGVATGGPGGTSLFVATVSTLDPRESTRRLDGRVLRVDRSSSPQKVQVS